MPAEKTLALPGPAPAHLPPNAQVLTLISNARHPLIRTGGRMSGFNRLTALPHGISVVADDRTAAVNHLRGSDIGQVGMILRVVTLDVY